MKASPAAAGKVSVMAALAAAAGLLAGCGSSGPSAQPTVTVTVTVTAPAAPSASPAPPTPAGPAGCLTTELAVSLGPGSGAAGSTYYPIEFTNASGATCSLYG